MNFSILVVEDEIKISDLICKYLSIEGYSFYQAFSGFDALQKISAYNPDLIILDIMLPEINGLEICQKIRETSNVPIIILTARVDDIDRLMGFAKGADDYVCKPFNPNELMARVKAILRRIHRVIEEPKLVTIGPVTINTQEYCVLVNGIAVQLTRIEFNILSTLMSNPHQVFSREDLLTSTHGKYSEVYDRSIDFHIKNLRKKINLDENFVCIKSVYGLGFKFN
jgi:two-component system, OmpR family, response regulator BaeR